MTSSQMSALRAILLMHPGVQEIGNWAQVEFDPLGPGEYHTASRIRTLRPTMEVWHLDGEPHPPLRDRAARPRRRPPDREVVMFRGKSVPVADGTASSRQKRVDTLHERWLPRRRIVFAAT